MGCYENWQLLEHVPRVLIFDIISNFSNTFLIGYALSDLVSFEQLKKREKQPWRSATFS